MGSTYPVWGWGEPGQEPRPADLAAAAPGIGAVLGFPAQEPELPAALPELPAPRVPVPASLAGLAGTGALDRARHALGRSYRDVVRGIRGQLDHVPDAVLRPRTEAEVAAVLDWAGSAGVAVVPFGGGTSVVGGVEPDVGEGYRGVVSLDLEHLAGVVEVDPVSRAALVRAGTLGPRLDAELARHGLTARFYPQSFVRSSVGGWVATRAAGHYAARLQHVDDLVESLRAVTPAGVWESGRLPGSGAGPSPDRWLLGSEGTLGVVTQAWLRVQERPTHRARATLAGASLAQAAAALRTLVQAGLAPASCRVVDAAEYALTAGAGGGTPAAEATGARATGAGATGAGATGAGATGAGATGAGPGAAVLVLGAEATGRPVAAELAAAVACARDCGLVPLPGGGDGGGGDGGGGGSDGGGGGGGGEAGWRAGFQRAPLVREQLVLLGVLTETLETAVTWERLDALVAGVTDAVEDALARVCGGGRVTCRLTHAYPDGAAPYFTVLAPARRGSELAQWAEVKAAASEAVLAGGGTITHHHAVGRDHRPWYDRQRPELFAAALGAAKAVLDPAGVLNPGVLLPPAGPSQSPR